MRISRFGKVGDGRFADGKGATHVDPVHQVVLLERRFQRRSQADGAGIVHDDINPSEPGSLPLRTSHRATHLSIVLVMASWICSSLRISQAMGSAWPPAASTSAATECMVPGSYTTIHTSSFEGG